MIPSGPGAQIQATLNSVMCSNFNRNDNKSLFKYVGGYSGKGEDVVNALQMVFDEFLTTFG